MAEIRKYVVHDDNDRPVTEIEHENLDEAIAEAEAVGGLTAVVELVYTFDDSELVWTSTGDDTWPPPKDRR